jgi:hypothetical protein
MIQVWDGDLFLFYCEQCDADLYQEQGFSLETEPTFD